MDNYNKELENKLIEMTKQKEESDRFLLKLEWIIGFLSCIILILPAYLGSVLPMAESYRIIVAFSGFIPAFIGIGYAIKIEQIAGYYVCKHCGHKYVPTLKAIIFAPHIGRTRHMTCPKCSEKSWQKKVISKD